jgi:hypothetical protein
MFGPYPIADQRLRNLVTNFPLQTIVSVPATRTNECSITYDQTFDVGKLAEIARFGRPQ